MNAGTVSTSTVLILLLVYVAGVPAKAARGGLSVPEFKVTVTGVRTIPVPIHPPRHPKDLPDTNFSKLRISPRSYWIELMPGDIEEITVTVKNVDNMTISIDPKVIVSPYSEHPFAEDWIVMGYGIAELEPGSKEEFSFMVEIPIDAECGHYSMQVAFTGGVEQTPYPTPHPGHKNAFGMSVEVRKPPVIRVLQSHIHDRVESDQEYDYQSYRGNVDEEDLGIDHGMSDDGWYYELYGTAPASGNDAITIGAPSVVPAGGNATANLHLSVPAGAKGRYVTCRSGSSHDECHFFDVALAGSNGDAALNITGIVNLGGSDYIPPPTGLVWETGGGACTMRYGEYREHYIAIAGSSIVDRELKMPSYIEEFEYTIEIGEAGLNR